MYPLDRRIIAFHLYSLLSSVRKTALLAKVSRSTVHRWLKQPERKQYTRKTVSKSSLVVETIKMTIQSDPFISLCKLQSLIQTTLGIQLSKEFVRTVLKRNNYTKKKARFYGEPKGLKDKTMTFLEKRNVLIQQGRTIVSIDETSFGRSGAPVFGYSKKGEKLFVRKNRPNLKNTSVVACFNKDGLIGKQSKQGSFTKTSFLEFLKKLSLEPNTVILLDNASIHHSNVVKEFASANQLSLLYTPPYSPWYNPIEFCFSIVKRAYYKTQDVESSFSQLTRQHCNAFFSKSLCCHDNKI